MQDVNTLVFYVASEAGTGISVESPITGEITSRGRKMRITIPLALRQSVPGVDASLTGLNQSFGARKGKNYLVRSTSCRGGKHGFAARLVFSERADGAAVPAPASGKATSRCRK